MKVTIFLFSFIISTGISWSQVKPIVNIGYGALLKEYRFQEFQLGGGVQLNDHFSLQLNYRYMYYEFNMHPEPFREPMKNGILSFSSGYRMLSKKKVISPLLMLDIGTPLHSNANNAFISSFFIHENYSAGIDTKYNRGLFFGKLKAMCDIELKSFDILLGGSYNLFIYSKSFLNPVYAGDTPSGYSVVKKHSVSIHNFGIEASLMYTIPYKKEK